MARRYPRRPASYRRYEDEETYFEPVPNEYEEDRRPRRKPRPRRARASHRPHTRDRGPRRRSGPYREKGPRAPPRRTPRPRPAPVPMQRPIPIDRSMDDEEPPAPERRIKPGKTPFTSGTYAGLLGKVLYLIAIFLPWYVVMANVQAGDYSTGGWVELVKIDGMRGVQINELLAGGGLPRPVSWLPVPLGWVLLFFFVWSIISIYRAPTARKRGWKFVRGGFVILIIFGVVYFMVSRLPTMVPEGSPDALRLIVEFIAKAPLGGTATRTFGIYGSVDLTWGLEMGGYLLFFSGVLQLFGGLMEWGSGKR